MSSAHLCLHKEFNCLLFSIICPVCMFIQENTLNKNMNYNDEAGHAIHFSYA